MAELKAFCRIKGLDYGAKAKLTAYYEHLYPEQIIVDEKGTINDLPYVIREELVPTPGNVHPSLWVYS